MIKRIINNKLFKDSLTYVMSDVINKAIPFLLLPVLTYYLTPSDYGILASFNSVVSFVIIFIGFSVQGAINVNYYKFNKDDLSEYIGNALLVLFSSFGMAIIVIALFKDFFYHKMSLSFIWMITATIIALLSYFAIINLNLWIMEQKPKLYGIFQVTETILKLGFSLGLIIIFSMSWQGRVLGMFIGGIISGLLSFYLLYRRGYLKFKYSKAYLKDIFYFGIPLIPHQLSFWLRSGAIIFILVYLVGEKETGLYSVGLQLVLPISVLTTAFNKAWAPYLYRTLSEEPNNDIKIKIVKFTYAYFFALLLITYIATLIIPYVIDIFLEKSFSKSYIYIIYLAYGVAFQGMYSMVVNYIFYQKKNKYLAYITFASSAVNVLLAYLLININGAIGAAQAILITSFVSFILVWYYSNRVYRMPWVLKRNI